MADPQKKQIGDGGDNIGQAAQQMGRAVKQSAKQTAAKGAAATANSAAAAVKVGAKTGKAVSQIAAGTAAGGPVGAVLSALWSMRHTLFKILVCVCLFFVFLVILIASLPSIITNSAFGLDGEPPREHASLIDTYTEMAGAVNTAVDNGYARSLARVEQLIDGGNYDYELSMEALINYAQSSAGFDVSYVLAAYSASTEQQNAEKTDMCEKLAKIEDQMFPVTTEEKAIVREVPVIYTQYKPITVTVVTEQIINGVVNGIPRYTYITASKTLFQPDAQLESAVSITVEAYKEVSVLIPVYSNGAIIGAVSRIYYEPDGYETLIPGTETIKYLECTIHPFDNTVINTAFGVDSTAQYGQSGVTYNEVIQQMATALKRTVYGSQEGGQTVPLSDAELINFVNRQNCTPVRRHILTTALSLVGKVPYFWGGKSAPGWNDDWNTPRLVTAAGSATSGTVRPYGLDCSGYTDWVYKTALGISLQAGNSSQWTNSSPVSANELLPGDLGFRTDESGDWTHVLIFAGYSEDGTRMWVHCSSGKGVVINSPGYEASLSLRRPNNVDFEASMTDDPLGDPIMTLEVEVTHYCACSRCCGSNADGYVASGKVAAVGMVAMSSYYPFGTQIMINDIMYTVEDRGGSGIENNIHRVDIFVPDHQEALRLGRYTTTAYIYRLGR